MRVISSFGGKLFEKRLAPMLVRFDFVMLKYSVVSDKGAINDHHFIYIYIYIIVYSITVYAVQVNLSRDYTGSTGKKQ